MLQQAIDPESNSDPFLVRWRLNGEDNSVGFRVASVPEPSSLVLAALGFVGLVGCGRWRRTPSAASRWQGRNPPAPSPAARPRRIKFPISLLGQVPRMFSGLHRMRHWSHKIRPFWLGQVFLLIAVPSAPAATPYYVFDQGSVQSSAGGTGGIGSDSHSYSSGNLVQQTVSGGTSTTSSGMALEFGGPVVVNVPQLAFGYVNDTAAIGALHATLSAHSDTGLGNLITPPFDTGGATASIGNTVIWSDTVNFQTNNPAGSDYLLSLHVDDSITAGGKFFYFESGFFGGSMLARVDFTNSNFDLGAAQALVIQDIYSQNSDGTTISQIAPDHDVSVVIHADYGQFLRTTVTGRLVTTAAAQNGTGAVLVDAGNTALFTLSSSDPLATYTTGSGTVFATSVPEPGTAWLALSAIFFMWRRRPSKHPTPQATPAIPRGIKFLIYIGRV